MGNREMKFFDQEEGKIVDHARHVKKLREDKNH